MVAVLNQFNTDDEIKKAEYDRRCEDELTDDNKPSCDIIAETYEAIEADNLDTIRFLQTDVALWQRIKEQFADHPTIPQYARFFIDYESHEINEIRRQIEIDRETASEFKRICG